METSQSQLNNSIQVFKTSKIIFLGDILLMPILIGFYTFIRNLIYYYSETITTTPDSLEMKRGILVVEKIEVPYSKVNSIHIKQSILGRIFNFGTVIISTGNDTTGIVFRNIHSPNELKQRVNFSSHSFNLN